MNTLVMNTLVICLLAGVALCEPASEPRAVVKAVADAVIRDFPDPLPFQWGEGVLLTGMMRAHELTGDARYLEFVRRFAEHWHRKGIGSLLAKRGYCGHWGPGLALLELHAVSQDKDALALAREIIDFMLQKAERTSDGGLSHFNGKPQLWADTLDMCCPVLVSAAKKIRQPELQVEAVRQLKVFSQHLQDPQSGLFYHMWDENTGLHTPSFWARGNGWLVLSYTDVLKQETRGSAAFQELATAYGRQMKSILKLQDAPSGLWHTVLDEPDTCLETSASAMFLYGLVEARRHHLLDQSVDAALQRGWQGLCTKITSDGHVGGVSGGTGPSDKAGYQTRPVGTFTWGTGALLMAASAYALSGEAAAVPETRRSILQLDLGPSGFVFGNGGRLARQGQSLPMKIEGHGSGPAQSNLATLPASESAPNGALH